MSTQKIPTMKELRKGKKLTQSQMAELTDLSIGGYAKIERGECSPNTESLQKIAQALGVSMEVLMEKDSVVIINDEATNHFPITNSLSSHQSITNFYHKTMQFDEALQSSELALLQAKLDHLQEIIAQKDIEIGNLKEIIELLKKSK